MMVSNSQEPIDMDRVIDFYEKITGQEDHQKRMRDYALEHFTRESILEPIVGLLK